MAEHSIEDECDAAIGLAEAYRNLADITQAADVLKLGICLLMSAPA
jgi:hypothetical protein